MVSPAVIRTTVLALLAATAVADFKIWRVTELKMDCVDAHCRPVPEGYGAKVAKKGDCKHASDDASGAKGGGTLGMEDGMYWKDGVCGSVKNFKCTKNKDGTYDCAGPNGEGKSHCTDTHKGGESYTCHTGLSGDDTYHEMMNCVGPISC